MLSQIVLCRPVPMMPDFNAEEKASIEKDAGEMRHIIAEMAECMPKEDPDKGTAWQHIIQGFGKRVVPRFGEFFSIYYSPLLPQCARKIPATWEPLFSPTLHI